MSYIDQASNDTRPGGEEQLDWLMMQSELLNEQNRLLHDIRRHTRLAFAACIVWLVAVGLALLVYLIWVIAGPSV